MSVNTLLNTKWQINAALQPPQGGIGPLDLQFSSNSTEYTSLELEDNQNSLDIYYNSTHVFDTNTWSNQNYRIIYIYGGTDVTDSDMIDWLEEYAIQLDVDIKSVNVDWLDANMRLAANAIRAKGGASSTISCPEGLSSAISDIPTSGVVITGTTDVSAKAMENITAGDSIYMYENYDNFAFSPTKSCNSCVWSPDSTKVAFISGSDSPVYNMNILNPTVLGTVTGSGSSAIYGGAWSPDGAYLALAHAGGNYVSIYNISTFTKISAPSTKPAGTGYACAWNPAGTRLAVAHGTSPYITIYDTTTTPYTKLDNPGTLPTGNGWGCAWSPDGKHLAVAHATSPYITIYDTTTTPYTKMTNPDYLPGSTGYGCAWSPNGTYLAVAYKNSPYMSIYTYDTGTSRYKRVATAGGASFSALYSFSWSPDGTKIALSGGTSPYIRIYTWSGTALQLLSTPHNIPNNAVAYSTACAWSPNGKMLAMPGANKPWCILLYNTDGNVYCKASNAIDTTMGGSYGYSKTTTASGSTGTAAVVFSP